MAEVWSTPDDWTIFHPARDSPHHSPQSSIVEKLCGTGARTNASMAASRKEEKENATESDDSIGDQQKDQNNGGVKPTAVKTKKKVADSYSNK